MTGEELERLYMDIYDNGFSGNDYKEKFKRYVNNRLESLEKENEKLRTKYLQATDEGTSWAHLKSLEQENAQLKEANQTLATMNKSMWVELEMKRAESQGIMNRLHQLAKAKEIIKDLLLMAKVENLERNYESVDEAKQFLSEVAE